MESPTPTVSLEEIVHMKIISLGSTGVGKSCLIKRYCEEKFEPRYISTIGVDYGVKQLSLFNREVKVHFWDLSGHPDFVEVRNEFYRDTHAVMLVMDVNNRKSFEHLDMWLREAEKYGVGNPLVFVCGNKTDINRRTVSEKEAKAWATTRNFEYYETSANTGENVDKFFENMFQRTLERILMMEET